eukprot:74109-Amphidinium_carterae.1
MSDATQHRLQAVQYNAGTVSQSFFQKPLKVGVACWVPSVAFEIVSAPRLLHFLVAIVAARCQAAAHHVSSLWIVVSAWQSAE